MVFEDFLAFFQADRIDHALALGAFQPGFDHRPFGGVDHQRHPGDVRLGGDQVEKGGHCLLGIEQAFIHIDVE